MSTPNVSGVGASSEATYVSGASGSSKSKEIGTIEMVDNNDNGVSPEEQAKQKKAKETLTKAIADGNADYNQTNLLGSLGGLIFDKNGGDYVTLSVPNGTSLGDIRKQYNLPPGSLRHLVISGGGDFDSYIIGSKSCPGPAYIYTDNLAEGLGITKRELKGMFPPEHFSSWYNLTGNDK